jgi:ATP-dependent RNA helicase DeaD
MAPHLLAVVSDDAWNPRQPNGPDALVITPTRELAGQVQDELGWLFAGVRGIDATCVTGGTNIGAERRALARNPRIVVGTPGRLLDHIRNGALDVTRVMQLVLDEADQMLDMGFRDELEAILESMPDTRNTHLVSATFPPAVRRLTERYQRDPIHVEGSALGTANTDIEHVGHLIHGNDRYAAIVNLLLLAESQRTLIFVNTRIECATLAEKLAGDGFSALPLSGELAQAQRTRTLSAFRAGTVTVLVATDVAARGLDVPDVATILHAGLPIDGEVYTHRSGRTGRAGQTSAPFGATRKTPGACSPIASSRGRWRITWSAWASRTWSCCRSPSTPSTGRGATRPPATSRRPRATARRKTSCTSSTCSTSEASA